MKQIDEYINKWYDFILKAATNLRQKNFDEYEHYMELAAQVSNEMKRNNELTYECKNFGIINYIFEDALPFLFKKNKGAIKEYVNTIKNDKNLIAEAQFYNSLKKYNQNLDINDYINELLNLTKLKVDNKSLNESNEKLNKIIQKYDIKPNDVINEELLKLFENCDFLIKNKKTINNLSDINQKFNYVANYTKSNHNYINEEKKDVFSVLDDFEAKNLKQLNEEEKKLMKKILSSDIKVQEEIFNESKIECINLINDLLKETSEKNELLDIKEQVESKVYNSNTFISDIKKLIEIKDILIA